jgi:hypothetical protein
MTIHTTGPRSSQLLFVANIAFISGLEAVPAPPPQSPAAGICNNSSALRQSSPARSWELAGRGGAQIPSWTAPATVPYCWLEWRENAMSTPARRETRSQRAGSSARHKARTRLPLPTRRGADPASAAVRRCRSRPTTAFASARALSPFAASRQADREIEQSRRRARSRLAGDSCSLYDGAEYRSSEIVGRGGIW